MREAAGVRMEFLFSSLQLSNFVIHSLLSFPISHPCALFSWKLGCKNVKNVNSLLLSKRMGV